MAQGPFDRHQPIHVEAGHGLVPWLASQVFLRKEVDKMNGRKQLNKHGFFEWKPGPTLAWMLIVNGSVYEYVYEPEDRDLERVAHEYGIDEDFLKDIVFKKDPETNGLIIDVPKYLASLEEAKTDEKQTPRGCHT